MLIGMIRTKRGRGTTWSTEKVAQRALAARPGGRGSQVRTRGPPGAGSRLVRTRATKPRVQPSLRRRSMAANGRGPSAPTLALVLSRMEGGARSGALRRGSTARRDSNSVRGTSPLGATAGRALPGIRWPTATVKTRPVQCRRPEPERPGDARRASRIA